MNTLLPRRLDVRTLAGATLAALAPGLALAGPHGESVVAGAATVGRPDLLTTVVTQTSAAAVINWQQFNVGADEFVVFQQPSSSSVVLNRIVGNDATQIFGSISANGRVFLANPNGVLFAPGARLDLGGLVATTFAISDDDFMAGRYEFARAAGAPDAGVVNQGTVQTAAGGFVVLAGDFVRNEGVIVAPAGSVVLASGARTTLNLDGMGLVDFAVDEPTLSAAAGVSNAGRILAEGGMVVMTARVANQLVATVVNNTGLVRASRIADRGGELWLLGEGGDVANAGVLDASGVDGDGGRVVVWGDRDATIAGTIVADGAGDGAGGEVRAIAEGRLDLAPGSVISARGGPDSESAGGMVEVSGHGALSMRGLIDLGTGGELVIDPSTVTLLNGASSVAGGSVGSIHVQFINAQLTLGNDVKVLASSSINASSSAAAIVSSNANGDLLLQIGTAAPTCQSGIAQGICVSPPAFGSFTPASGGNISLADLDINIAGVLTVSALDGNVTLGDINVGQAMIGASTERVASLTLATAFASAGDLVVHAVSSVTASGVVAATGTILIAVDGASDAAVSLADVSAGGSIGIVANAPTGNASISLSGNAIATGGVQLAASGGSGAAIVSVSGAVSGGGLVQLDAVGSGATPGTIVTVNGSVTGGAVTSTTFAGYTGGHIYLFGNVTATSGNIDLHANGFGVGSAAGNVGVGGAVSAVGNVDVSATDANGGGGGTISMYSVSGGNVSLQAHGFGAGSGSGGGQVIVGTSSGPSVVGGAVNATGTLMIDAQADADVGYGGTVVIGAVTVGGNASITVGGGNGGGLIVVGALSSGSVVGVNDVDVGGDLSISATGDVGGLVAGAITADWVAIDIERSAGIGSRAIEITTGAITATGIAGSDSVALALANTSGPGTATITVNGAIQAAGLVVDVRAATAASGSDAATITVGDVFAATAFIDNDLGGSHAGSITLGAATVGSIQVDARGDVGAGNLDATGLIRVESAVGSIVLGDLTAINAGAPVEILVGTNGLGATIDVGAITATGQRATVGTEDAGARVTIDAGPSGGGLTVVGAIDVEGIGRSFSSSEADSFANWSATGFAGVGNVHLSAGSNATLTVVGAISVDGVAGAHLELSGQTVSVSGAVTVTAAPGNITVNGTLSSLACGTGCSVSFVESRTNGGEARVTIAGIGSNGLVDANAITVVGPQAMLELYGETINTGNLSATGGASVYVHSSNGTIGGQAHAFADSAQGGGAQIEVATGLVPGTGSIAISGSVSATAPGMAGVSLEADLISVGSVTVNATGGLYTRSGQAANPGLSQEGPWGKEFGDELPPISTGTFTGGVALIEIGGGASCSTCGATPATTVDVFGNLSATAPAVAVIQVDSLDTDVFGSIATQALGGSRVGTYESSYFDSLSSISYARLETVDFTGGAARINVGGDGVLHVSGATTADGAFASIDLGITAGSLGAVTLDIGGGDAQISTSYDAAGTADDFTTSFQGPGALQGVVIGPDSGGSGTILINGPITVDAVGFGAVIVRAGTLTTHAIDIDVASANYQYFDSRIDGAPVSVTTGDAILAVHQQAAPGSFSRASVNGPVTVDVTGDLFLRSQFAAPGTNATLVAGSAVSENFSAHLDRVNGVTCDGGSCSLGSYAPVDLEVLGGSIIGTTAVDLPTGSITFGGGDAGTGADAVVSSQFGLGTNPNGVIKSLGALDLGHVGVNGSWVLLEAGTFGAIGTAAASAGAVVQFVVAGGGDLQLEQSGSGAGIVSANDDLLAFAGTGVALVFGHSTSPGQVQVGQLGPVDLSLDAVTLIGPGGINGSGTLAAASLTLNGGLSAVALTTDTGDVTLGSASSFTLDNSASTGTTNLTLPTNSPGSLAVQSGGVLNVFGDFAGVTFVADAGGTLHINDSLTATTSITLVTGGAFSSGLDLMTTGALTLQGVAGVTDFAVVADAAAITVGDANSITVDNTARTGALQLAIPGGSPAYLDLDTGGTLTLSGAFAGTDLYLSGSALDLGLGDHAATNIIDLVTGGALNSPGTLTTTTLSIDATPTTALALVTEASTVAIDEGASLTLDGSSFVGSALLFLPTGITSATIDFGGNGQVNGGFDGIGFDVAAAGDLTLSITGIDALVGIQISTGGAFSSSGTLSAPSLTLAGAAGVTDFVATTDVGAITVGAANGVALDNSAHTGATSLALSGPSPDWLDVQSGGSLVLSGAFAGTTLTLDAAALALGASAHSASGSISLTTAGTLTSPALLTAPSITIDAAPGTSLLLTTQTTNLGIDEASFLGLDNTAETASISLALPAGITAANLAFGGGATVSGGFSGTGISVDAPGDLNLLGTGYSATGNVSIVTGGLFFTNATLSAGTLLLDGTAGVTDFFATTVAASITIDGANSVALDNSGRTGATTLTLVGTSPDSVDLISGGAIALSGAFSGSNLTLDGTSLDLGGVAHSATGTISLTTDGVLNTPSLLTAATIVVDAAPTTVLVLSTDAATITIDAGSSLALDNSAHTGAVSLALPVGISAANLEFGGGATISGDFSGTAFTVVAAGDLDLLGASYTASGSMLLDTGGLFFTAGTLAASILTLEGTAGVTDFFATTDAGTLNVDGADAVALDNSAHTGAAFLVLLGTSPSSLDVASGGDLALTGVFTGTSLTLAGANLALGTGAHTASGAIDLSATASISATGLLTAGSFSAATSGAAPLAFSTNTASISIAAASGSSLSINNSAFTGAVSMSLPVGLTIANLAFGGDATLFGDFDGGSLNFAAGGFLDLAGSAYTTTGAMFLNTGTGLSASGPLTAGGLLTLRDASGTASASLTTDAGAFTLDGWGSLAISNDAHTGATTVDFGIVTPDNLDLATGGALTLTEQFAGASLALQGASLNLGGFSHSATGGIVLISEGALVATGTLAAGSLFIDGAATTAVALVTTTADLYIAEAGAVAIDATPSGGTLSLGFGSGQFGDVAVGCLGDVLLTSGITAASFALAASGSVDDGGVAAAGPGPLSVAMAGTVTADVVFIEADGDLRLGNTSFAIGVGDGVTGVSDQLLLTALAGAAIGPGSQTVSNGTFLAGGALELGSVTSQGSYLVLQGDQLTLSGTITGPADLLVQVAPATASNTFSVEDSSPGAAATNYVFAGELDQITALTLVIGASSLSGDATVGANGAFDVAPMNLIVATSGTVTGIGNVTSTGIVDTLSGLLGLGEDPIPPPPILEEIDPGVANPLPPVDTEAGVEGTGDGSDEEDDEGEDTSEAGADEDETDGGLVTQQNAAPAGVCGK